MIYHLISTIINYYNIFTRRTIVALTRAARKACRYVITALKPYPTLHTAATTTHSYASTRFKQVRPYVWPHLQKFGHWYQLLAVMAVGALFMVSGRLPMVDQGDSITSSTYMVWKEWLFRPQRLVVVSATNQPLFHFFWLRYELFLTPSLVIAVHRNLVGGTFELADCEKAVPHSFKIPAFYWIAAWLITTMLWTSAFRVWCLPLYPHEIIGPFFPII